MRSLKPAKQMVFSTKKHDGICWNRMHREKVIFCSVDQKIMEHHSILGFLPVVESSMFLPVWSVILAAKLLEKTEPEGDFPLQ